MSWRHLKTFWVACRPQDNPTFTSCDGVPLELVVLGFRRRPACTGQTGRRHRSDRPAAPVRPACLGFPRCWSFWQSFARSSTFECVGAILCQHNPSNPLQSSLILFDPLATEQSLNVQAHWTWTVYTLFWRVVHHKTNFRMYLQL